jgi:hypothetical protein
MEGDLDDLHEARDRHDQTLYRLYLKWDADASTVWVLDGRTKPNNTRLADAEYTKIRALADAVTASTATAASANDIAKLFLESAP